MRLVRGVLRRVVRTTKVLLVVVVSFSLALLIVVGTVILAATASQAAPCTPQTPQTRQVSDDADASVKVDAPAGDAARERIPTNYLALYEKAGAEYKVPWTVLAGIGKIESNHGRAWIPGVRKGLNKFGCCAGPMQFNIRNGPPSTWGSYRIDGNGDGKFDIFDPADAIASAGNYLQALLKENENDIDRAVFGYNHDQSYVNEVLELAALYGGRRVDELAAPANPGPNATQAANNADCGDGGGLDGAVGPASLQSAVRVVAPAKYTKLPKWAMAGSREPAEVDARLYDNMVWVLRRYHLAVTAGMEDGHNTHGDGTALDLIPADGSAQAIWDASAGRAARDLGWTPACGGSGGRLCNLVPAIHWIGYEGYPGHGSPRTCSGDCYAHLHLSWDSPCYGTGTPSPPCSSVMTFPLSPLNPAELST